MQLKVMWQRRVIWWHSTRVWWSVVCSLLVPSLRWSTTQCKQFVIGWLKCPRIWYATVTSRMRTISSRHMNFHRYVWLIISFWWGAGVLDLSGANANDLHMVQLMPLPPPHLLLH